MVRIVFSLISMILIVESVVLMLNTKLNIGTVFVYLLTFISVMYVLFFETINDFCSAGIGRVFAVLFCIGMGFYLVMFIIVSTISTEVADGKQKAVIILGAGLNGVEVSDTLRYRLDVAIEYYNTYEGVTLCVTGSKGRFEVIPEAVAMQRYLLDNGIPTQDILVDPNSDNTKENIQNAMQLFTENNIDTSKGVALATNRFHCYRSLSYAKQQGIDSVSCIPAAIPIAAFHSSHSREVFALLKHWLFER